MSDIGSSVRLVEYRGVNIHPVKPVDRDGHNARDDFRDTLDRRQKKAPDEAGAPGDETPAPATEEATDQILLSSRTDGPAPDPGSGPDAFVPSSGTPPATPPDAAASPPGEAPDAPPPPRRRSEDDPPPAGGGHLTIQA